MKQIAIKAGKHKLTQRLKAKLEEQYKSVLITTKQCLAGPAEILPHEPPPELGAVWCWHRALQATA